MLCSGAGGVLAFVVYLLLSLGQECSREHSCSPIRTWCQISMAVMVMDQLCRCSSQLEPQHPPALHQQGEAVPAQPEAMGELSSAKLGEGKGPPVSRAGRAGNCWGMAEPQDGAAAGEQQVLLQSSSSFPSGRIQCGQSSVAAGQCQADSRPLSRKTFPSHSGDTSVC